MSNKNTKSKTILTVCAVTILLVAGGVYIAMSDSFSDQRNVGENKTATSTEETGSAAERPTKTIASEQLGFSVAYYCLDWCNTEPTIKTGEEAGGYFDYSADIPTNTENRTLNVMSLTRASADKFERLVREASESGEEVGDPVFFNYSFDDLKRVWQESEVGKNYEVAYREGAQTDNFQAVELAGQKALYQSRGTRGYYGLMHNYYIHLDGDRWLYIYALTSEESNGDFVEEVIASISVE